MSFISEDEKYRFSVAIDNVLSAKILLSRRGVYPEKLSFYPTDHPYISSEDVLYNVLQMIEMGTEWEVKDLDTDEKGIIKWFFYSSELEKLYQCYGQLSDSQREEFERLLSRYKILEYDDRTYFYAKVFFGTDGHISFYSEYLNELYSEYLNDMLDFQDEMKRLLEEFTKSMQEVA